MIRKTLLTIAAAFAMLALGSVARADTITFGPGQFGSTATVTDYSLNAAKTTFTFTLNNTSSTGSITAIGFDLAARTDGQSRGTFTLTSPDPSLSNFSVKSEVKTTAGANTNSENFDFALLTGGNFGGGTVALGVTHGTSMTFTITGDFSGLTAEQIATNLFLRFQGIGRQDNSEVIGPGNPGNPVPEPMTMILFGTGLAGIAARARRRRNNKA
ncbi:MAG TPA: PEP-CTERM sorting domain-containing protein [Pyrinomonadaceae bacterium]|jgi:hypothetical protein|nr:PEP-CTERM sorting domain-containing protein [Pyrinomonadaceae bacterium]